MAKLPSAPGAGGAPPSSPTTAPTTGLPPPTPRPRADAAARPGTRGGAGPLACRPRPQVRPGDRLASGDDRAANDDCWPGGNEENGELDGESGGGGERGG